MLSTSSLQTLILASASLLPPTDANSNLFLKKPRIIGGITAASDRYPYTVALTSGGADFFCGGSLVAPDMVLTAAHCLGGGFGGGGYNVAVGRSDLTSDEGEEISVAQEIQHPDYSWSTDENDFALLLLSQPVSVLSEGDIVRINGDASFPAVGDMSRTMGWGDTDPDDAQTAVSNVLLEVDLPVISNEECRSAEGSDNGYTDSYESYIFDSMLCTLSEDHDACQGDSGRLKVALLFVTQLFITEPHNSYIHRDISRLIGGPLIIPGSSASEDILVGVTSWGIGCATKIFPGVFARISNSYDWIAETICAESTDPPGYLCNTPEPTLEPTKKPTPEVSQCSLILYYFTAFLSTCD
jgi:secreted trypsin-like serine protease